MRKSLVRKELERLILDSHHRALAVATEMVDKEFGGNLDQALSDTDFVTRVQVSVREEWDKYLAAYCELELLEETEGFPAIHWYASRIDAIAQQLPTEVKALGYYPFCGIDFYWARVFKKTVFEDIGFGKQDMPNMWWEPARYGKQGRKQILAKLFELTVIPPTAKLTFVSGNAEVKRRNNDLNRATTTLIVKGGHDFLHFFGTRFKNERPLFGAIISISAVNTLRDIEHCLSAFSYEKVFSCAGNDFIAPYAMELRDAHVFLKYVIKA
ncbi:MAG: hypothetical protein G01um101448_49 [Parcubacteria group bacterium Gr01-1014_48]|nr:MAG: hypothetical protein G01um101448_49 [Parcubacteria group bacterium Gr01-1014_48]